MPISTGGSSFLNKLINSEQTLDLVSDIVEKTSELGGDLMDKASDIGEGIVNIANNVGDNVVDFVDTVGDYVQDYIGNNSDGGSSSGGYGGGGSHRDDTQNHIPNGDGSVYRTPTSSDQFPIRLSQSKSSIPTGYPSGKSGRYQIGERTIVPRDHFNYLESVFEGENKDDLYYINNKEKHFTRDVNDPALKDIPVLHKSDDNQPEIVFSGSTTHINPTDDPEKADIILQGLEGHETDSVRSNSSDEYVNPPISPIHPFTRMDPSTAQKSNLTTYNRTKLPVADLEFRKGFRHIFFTRPECYIMSRNMNGGSLSSVLSEQCEYDEDFASSYSRMPHILKLLSPVYITGSFSQNGINSNWNYLLCNRVMGLTTSSTTLTVQENVTKSVEGFTVTPAMHMESRQGSTLDLKFRDTKNLEIYEMLRMWMLYMYKRKKGVFAPPYNGYQYRNGFLMKSTNADSSLPPGAVGSIKPISGDVSALSIIGHPYDRALEYCCSIFDIVTNESMTKILYWCKYYGAYPISVTPDGLTNDMNGPLTNEMSVSSQWKYHYKLENVNKTLVEFNFNAGITDNMGRIMDKNIIASHPFLLRDDPEDKIMKQYIGAGGMFTGSPYIILGQSQNDPLNPDNGIITPYLQFMAINDGAMNSQLNLGITNTKTETKGAVGIIDQRTAPSSSNTSTSDENGTTSSQIVDTAANVIEGVVDTLIDSTPIGGAINLVNTTIDVLNNTRDVVNDVKDTVNNIVQNGLF